MKLKHQYISVLLSHVDMKRYLGNVGLRGQADHDVQFLQFHIYRVVVLDKEDFDLLLQDLRPVQKQHTTYLTVGRQEFKGFTKKHD